MKMFFKIFLIFYFKNIFAIDPIIIQSFDGNIEQAKRLEKILISNFNFPADLILLKYGECKINHDSIMQICIDNNDEIKIVHSNFSFVKNNFTEFMKLRGSNVIK